MAETASIIIEKFINLERLILKSLSFAIIISLKNFVR